MLYDLDLNYREKAKLVTDINKNRFIKEFATLQLAINNHYEYIDLIVIELENTDLFLGYN